MGPFRISQGSMIHLVAFLVHWPKFLGPPPSCSTSFTALYPDAVFAEASSHCKNLDQRNISITAGLAIVCGPPLTIPYQIYKYPKYREYFTRFTYCIWLKNVTFHDGDDLSKKSIGPRRLNPLGV